MNNQHIRVQPMTPAIGAIISGVDISRDLDAAVIAEIRRAFLDHLVVFFRDQCLTPDRLVAFTRRFGDIGYYPFVAGMEGHPEVVEVMKKEDEKINFGGLWHTDTSYLERPPLGSVLYAVQVPPFGGDTLFSNMYLAYDSLSDGMKRLLAPLRAINSAEKPDAAVTRVHRIAESPRHADVVTTAIHPIVRTHPENGSQSTLLCKRSYGRHRRHDRRGEPPAAGSIFTACNSVKSSAVDSSGPQVRSRCGTTAQPSTTH